MLHAVTKGYNKKNYVIVSNVFHMASLFPGYETINLTWFLFLHLNFLQRGR